MLLLPRISCLVCGRLLANWNLFYLQSHKKLELRFTQGQTRRTWALQNKGDGSLRRTGLLEILQCLRSKKATAKERRTGRKQVQVLRRKSKADEQISVHYIWPIMVIRHLSLSPCMCYQYPYKGIERLRHRHCYQYQINLNPQKILLKILNKGPNKMLELVGACTQLNGGL